MVFEQLFKQRWIERRPTLSFFLGIIFTSISFFASSSIFGRQPHLIGIMTISLTALLVLPGINHLFSSEEKKEARQKQSFLKEHEGIIDFFLYFFLGVFLTFFIIALFWPQGVFSYNDFKGIPDVQAQPKLDIHLPSPPGAGSFESIVSNNLFVLMLMFLLSFFYGSGAVILISLNASVFASSFAGSIRGGIPPGAIEGFTYVVCGLGSRFLHAVPEMGAYLLVAIAGGVLSKAATREKLFSKGFFRVAKDAVYLLVVGIVLLLLGGWVESGFTISLIRGDICSDKLILALTFILGALLIVFELWRKEYLFLKKKKRK